MFQIKAVIDNDGDQMDDGWEIQYLQDIWQDGSMDHDGDGVSNLDEFMNVTDPSDPNDPPSTAGTSSLGLLCVPGAGSGAAPVVAAALGVLLALAAARRPWYRIRRRRASGKVGMLVEGHRASGAREAAAQGSSVTG